MFFLTPFAADPLKSKGELEYPLTKLLVFTEHKDTIRRGGVVSTIKLVWPPAYDHRLTGFFVEIVPSMFRHIVPCYHLNPNVSQFRHLLSRRQGWTSCLLCSFRLLDRKSST